MNRDREHKPVEREAVTTTIVGGRPPGPGQAVGQVPRGVEVLLKKAAVDADFKATLLEERSAAATRIDLKLEPAESAMIDAAPRAHLEKIIAETRVEPQHRRAFLGKVAALMLAAIGVQNVQCECPVSSAGMGIDAPDTKEHGGEAGGSPATRGIRPDRPKGN